MSNSEWLHLQPHICSSSFNDTSQNRSSFSSARCPTLENQIVAIPYNRHYPCLVPFVVIETIEYVCAIDSQRHPWRNEKD